jgi:hypothetical protein
MGTDLDARLTTERCWACPSVQYIDLKVSPGDPSSCIGQQGMYWPWLTVLLSSGETSALMPSKAFDFNDLSNIKSLSWEKLIGKLIIRKFQKMLS